jgi:predicted RNA binding protein YcfA (HicA-like mRNA interferase family)
LVNYLNEANNLKVRAVIKLVEEDGWFLDRTRGSHRQYKHHFKIGLVTISGNLDDEVPRGTLNSILKQSGIKEIGRDG